ncbi:MAG: hypothetical protein WD250_07280 [Egibacteraceae bacterium]
MTALPSNALVVRGGLIADLDALIEQAEDEHAVSGRYRLSTFCGVKDGNENDEDLLKRIIQEAPVPNGQVRTTRVGVLLDLGFSLKQTGHPDCHYDVDLGDELSLEVVERFEQAFEVPRRNPCR